MYIIYNTSTVYSRVHNIQYIYCIQYSKWREQVNLQNILSELVSLNEHLNSMSQPCTVCCMTSDNWSGIYSMSQPCTVCFMSSDNWSGIYSMSQPCTVCCMTSDNWSGIYSMSQPCTVCCMSSDNWSGYIFNEPAMHCVLHDLR